ncbi:MAG: glycine zipper 2TM domain-containing protein [Pseudomonadota bacterium]
MTARNIITRGAAGLAGVAMLAGALSIPTAASAQSYYQQAPAYQGGSSYYDPCRRDQVQRGTGGALVGGGLGALAGSSIAGRGAKTEGAVLGGILGAVIGSNVGKSGAACSTPYDPSYRGPAPQQGAYYDDRDGYDGYDGYREPGYQQPYQQPAYDPYDRYDDQYRMAPIADGPATADNCSLAESPIYLPDGRTQKRFVRVCRDARGEYQVVD